MAKTKKQDVGKRKVISLETKIQILDRLRKGDGPATIGRDFEIGESTVRGIRNIEKKIREAVIAGSNVSHSKTSHARSPIMEKMEKMLNLWLEDKNQKNMPIGGLILRLKAVRIFDFLQLTDSSISDPKIKFSGSKGWLGNFKKRFQLHNIKLTGETAAADHEAAKAFPPILQTIIEAGKYSANQIFNADETGLFWKKLPSRTYIAKSEKKAHGHKAAKDRVSLLFCSNAAGDFITKPLLINKSLNPRAFKNVDKKKLPVHWRANKKAWMTSALFEDWFYNSFVPEVEKYLKDKKLDFQVLLIIDNATCHPQTLYHPNVRIVFLPPNTTSLIQPMDQGIIATFKAIFLRITFEYILNAIDDGASVSDIWKKYTMLNCVSFIEEALSELKQSTLQGCWKKIWPSFRNQTVTSSLPPSPTQQGSDEIIRVTELARSIGGEGFVDLSVAETAELISFDEELSEQDLIDIIDGNTADASDDDVEVAVQLPSLTKEILNEGLTYAANLITFFRQHDPDDDRSSRFEREITKVTAQYAEIQKQIGQESMSRM